MAANEPGQPALAGECVHPQPRRAGDRPWRSAPIPTTSSSDAGRTLAKWAEAGCVVHHLICTDGSKGTWNPDADIAALAAQRQREQSEASRRLSGAQRRPGACSSTTSTASSTATCACAARSPESSASSGPRSCSATTRGSATACIPTIATPACWPARASSAPRPALLPRAGPAPAPARRAVAVRGRRARSRRRCRRHDGRYLERKLDALEAHASQFESTMKAVDEDQLTAFRAARQRPTGRARRAVRLRRRRDLQADH